MTEKKVLVIDDDVSIRSVIEDYLSEKGFTVLTAPDGKQGLELALNGKPDLILLDIDLPDQNGFDICKVMRQKEGLIHTPIIMLTGRTLEKDEVTGFSAGADDYVTKPFKSSLLLARIQSMISRSNSGLNANALTHLPGNRSITQEIDSRIESKEPFSVFYFDLNNFKAFNDCYGFLRGDEAIQMTAKILVENFQTVTDGPSFLGHVGGDDFIAITRSHDVEKLCQKIIVDFDNSIVALYDQEDQKSGGIVSVDRRRNKTTYPFMGLAIAVVTNKSKQYEHPGEISLIAGELKKKVKLENKSSFLVDRRIEN